MPVKSHIALAICCFFWATSFIATKIALETMGPMTLAGMRHVAACLCFFCWFGLTLKKEQNWPKFSGSLLANLFILSLLAVSAHHVAQITGLKYTSAANASVYAATGPIMIFLIAAVFLKERISSRKIFGIVSAASGVVLVMGIKTLLAFTISDRLYGDLLVIFSIFTWACFTVFSKKTITNLLPMQLTAAITFLGTATLLPLTFIELNLPDKSLYHVSLKSWLAAGFLGVTSSFVSNLLYLRALKTAESQKVAIYLYTIPPMTAFMAAFLLHEPITLHLITGTLLVFVGVFLLQKD